MKASLFIVLNEVNDVVAYKIVPNDKREHVGGVLETIFEESPIVTKAIYTDNPRADKSIVEAAFGIYFNGKILTLQVYSFIIYLISSGYLACTGTNSKNTKYTPLRLWNGVILI